MQDLIIGITSMTWQNLVMFGIAGMLIYLAIAKEYEPSLLLPMGFGAILANIPWSAVIDWCNPATGVINEGVLNVLFDAGIATELFPLLIFIAIGAMIDFKPLLQNPLMLLFGAAAQFGIFFTMGLATLLGFDLKEAASIGIIGAADGPTSIIVATKFAPHLLPAIMVAAYSYMALVPIIQRPVILAITTKKERRIHMDHEYREVSQTVKILFPIAITFITSVVVPSASALIGFLMFGNLLREAGVVDRLSKGAQNELANIVTILLGLTIAATMKGEYFLRPQTLMIIGMGLIAFVFDTAGGVLFAKLLNVVLPHNRKINPMVGACGISAFPMSARVVHKLGIEADPHNHLIMHAISSNVGGQVGSVIAGGLVLALVGNML